MTGSYFLHKAYLSSYKKEFKAHLLKQTNPPGCLHLSIHPCELYVNTATISWEDDNSELIYKGKLYDVLDIKSKGTKVSIILIPDENEELLKREFAETYNEHSSHAKKDPFSLLKNLFALKFIYTTNTSKVPGFTIYNPVFHPTETSRLISRYISQQVPPPRGLHLFIPFLRN